MTILKDFPLLYGLTSKGAIKQWHIKVISEDGDIFIVTTHGKKDGKQQQDAVTITSGKNLGRANQTTVEQQAIAEATSKWTEKKERDHYEETEEAAKSHDTAVQGPMLALKFADRGHNIKYPAYVQPKLNGVRVLAHVDTKARTVKFMSRKGKEYIGFPELKQQCLTLCASLRPNKIVLDGEFFNKDLSLQQIISRVKREKVAHEDAKAIQYHVYDIADDTLTFHERHNMFMELFDEYEDLDIPVSDNNIFYVETLTAFTVDAIAEHHQKFAQEYEGTMIRNREGKYKFNHRSADLLKMKDFEEEEFEIVDVHGEGKGREAGLALFVCKTKEGSTFTVRPRGSFEHRTQLLKDRAKLIGEQLTVRFLEWSADKVPQHPIGLTVRDYE